MSPAQKVAPFLGVALVLAGPARAGLVPISQTRTVDATARASVVGNSDTDSGAAAAPDFSLFDQEVDSLAVAISGTKVAIAEGVAKQRSNLGLNAVSATGDVSVGLTLTPQTRASATATANSTFQYEFTLTAASSYWLSGWVGTDDAVGGGSGLPSLGNGVVFENLGTATILFDSLTEDETFSLSGILDPGTYRLSATASASATQGSTAALTRTVVGTSSFEIDFRTKNLPESSTASVPLLLGALGGFTWLRRRRVLAP